jgi:hypothetical protein
MRKPHAAHGNIDDGRALVSSVRRKGLQEGDPLRSPSSCFHASTKSTGDALPAPTRDLAHRMRSRVGDEGHAFFLRMRHVTCKGVRQK